MKHFLYILLIAVFASCGSDNPGNSFDYDEDPPDDPIESGELIWSDEFNTDGQPSSSNWTYDIGHGDGG